MCFQSTQLQQPSPQAGFGGFTNNVMPPVTAPSPTMGSSWWGNQASPYTGSPVTPTVTTPGQSWGGGANQPGFMTNPPATQPQSQVGGGMNWMDLLGKVAGPAAMVGASMIGAKSQSGMMQDLSGAQQQSYDKYLQTINPPEAVKQARFNELKQGTLKQAGTARRRLGSQMASRGIRGKGAAAPIAETEEDIRDAINRAYFTVYGQYNVPGMPPPVNYAPSTGQLLGSQVGDLGTLLAMKQMFA